jgi:UDP-glucose 4-epimerase
VDIEVVCKTFIKFLNNLTNNIYNIGSSKGYSGQDIANEIFEVLNKKTKIIYRQKRNGDPDISISNNGKTLKHNIKYKNKSIKETIKKCKT